MLQFKFQAVLALTLSLIGFAADSHAGPTDSQATRTAALALLSSPVQGPQNLSTSGQQAYLLTAFSDVSSDGLGKGLKSLLLELRDRLMAEEAGPDNQPFLLSNAAQIATRDAFLEEYARAQRDRRNWYPFWVFRGNFNSGALWLRGPRVNQGVPPQIAQETDLMPTLIELIRRLEFRASTDAATWTPLLNAADQVAGSELLYFDRSLKFCAQFDPESAEKISAIVVAPIFSNEDPNQTKIAQRLFKQLGENSMLAVSADRTITGALSYFLRNISTPTRVWNFRISVALGLIAGAPMFIHNRDLHNLGFNIIAPILSYPARIWFWQSVAQILKTPLINTTQVLDQWLNAFRLAINKKDSKIATDRAGPLQKRCLQALESRT